MGDGEWMHGWVVSGWCETGGQGELGGGGQVSSGIGATSSASRPGPRHGVRTDGCQPVHLGRPRTLPDARGVRPSTRLDL